MSHHAYGQFCGLARAAELVGERWALLIVRDLLTRPRRFTDLQRGLPRIATNVLAARLRELEEAGIVRRRTQPLPAGGVVYELTEYGQELEPALVELARWGARSLGVPGPEEIVTVDSMIMALRSTFNAPAAVGLEAGFELRMGDVVVHARVHDGCLEAGAGSLTEADLIIETGLPLRELMSGNRTLDEAVRSDAVRCTGRVELLDRFVDAFPFRLGPAAPVR